MEAYDLWRLKFNLKKTKYMTVGYISRDLNLEYGIGTIDHENKIII